MPLVVGARVPAGELHPGLRIAVEQWLNRADVSFRVGRLNLELAPQGAG